MSNNNIIQLFCTAAEKQPDKVVLIHDNTSVTYAELLSDVKRTAEAYSRKGIEKDDKALVFVPVSIDLYRTVLALLYIGACPVFIDEWVSVGRLNKCCEVVPCKALIAAPKLLLASFFIRNLRRIPLKIKTSLIENAEISSSYADVNKEDTALVTFTTGTTGTPKAADRTHAFLYAQYNALRPMIDNNANLSFITLPIVTLINIGLGKTTMLPPKRYADDATTQLMIDSIATNKVDEIICSPSVILKLARHAGDAAEYIRYIFTGGGAVFPSGAVAIKEVFPDALSTVVYGSTEAEPVARIDIEELCSITSDMLQDGLPVGVVDNNTQCVIIPISDEPVERMSGADWQQFVLSAGKIGEIAVSGEHVLKAYVNNENAVSRNKINVNGQIWHRTGDAGRLDDIGKLFLFGPCKEIIHYEGTTYYPLITSYLFAQITDIAHAALLIINDRLTLVAETEQEINDILLLQARQQLNLKNAAIRYVKHIPKDKRHNTKVDYDSLMKILN